MKKEAVDQTRSKPLKPELNFDPLQKWEMILKTSHQYHKKNHMESSHQEMLLLFDCQLIA